MNDVILRATGILKCYPGNIALDHVDFTLYRNQINILIGENGAGKSTLMRILSGVETCDAGTITIDEKPIVLRSPRDAAANGISIVHQELSVMPNLDISDNIFAGCELKRGAIVDRRAEDAQSDLALHRLGKPMPVTQLASQLSLGCRQIVELARTIAHGSNILILDEPTSALSITEANALFRVLAELKQSGVTIVYISHRLHELLHLGDHFTVLRSGRVVGTAPRAEVTRQWIVERMSGRTGTPEILHDQPSSSEPILKVSNLGLSRANKEEAYLHDLTFTLHRGEILGIYGLLGAGRTELMETLAGGYPSYEGTIELNAEARRFSSVSDAIKAGIVLVPEDRQRDGLIPDLSVRENIALAAASRPILARQREVEQVRTLVRDLNIAVADIELPVTALSGGNQQKVLIARCLMRSPSVLLLDEPTRGVDVGAKEEIYNLLRKLARQGLSILFTSSEIEETRLLADRVLVLRQGCFSARFERHELTDEALFAAASPGIALGETA
ncbi:MAG TPA: sugar ABC transporter ATP-binding protein [Edaphobacter sp.]|jgi:erythritol transport system ATP-binding protein